MTPPKRLQGFVRSGASSAHRALARRAPTLAYRGLRTAAPALSLYAVCRQRNAQTVGRLLEQLGPEVAVHLHALDAVPDSLRHVVRATGPGMRMPLLEALMRQYPPRSGDSVLIADDDVAFESSSRSSFAGLAKAARLDFAMPAHAPGSFHTFRFTEQRSVSTVRLTAFVEIGPLLYLSPRACRAVVPFPVDARMGWGLDVTWAALVGMRRGVVDATPVRHVGAVGEGYDDELERVALARASTAAGVASAYELAHDLGPVWRPWQIHPPW